MIFFKKLLISRLFYVVHISLGFITTSYMIDLKEETLKIISEELNALTNLIQSFDVDTLNQNIIDNVVQLQGLSQKIEIEMNDLQAIACDIPSNSGPLSITTPSLPYWIYQLLMENPTLPIYYVDGNYFAAEKPGGIQPFFLLKPGDSNYWYVYDPQTQQYQLWFYNQFGVPAVLIDQSSISTSCCSNQLCSQLMGKKK